MFLCCRQDKLKRRLTLDFPQLVFHCPSKRNICELVFVETLSADKLIDRLPHPSGTDTTESTEVSQAESDTEHMARTTAGPQTTENTRTLYSAALILTVGPRSFIGLWHVPPRPLTYHGICRSGTVTAVLKR